VLTPAIGQHGEHHAPAAPHIEQLDTLLLANSVGRAEQFIKCC
jgi:hypothetical protein